MALSSSGVLKKASISSLLQKTKEGKKGIGGEHVGKLKQKFSMSELTKKLKNLHTEELNINITYASIQNLVSKNY